MLLAEAMEDGKVTKALAAGRLKDAKREGSDPDEIKALQHLLDLYNTEATAKRTAKEAQAALDLAALKKYGDLTETDVKALVLDNKWAATVTRRITGEVNSLTFALVERIQELGERYIETVGDIDADVAKLEEQVMSHLAKMGIR